MKTITFKGTEEQLKNLQLLMQMGDNTLPTEVESVEIPIYAEEYSEESWKYNCRALGCDPNSKEIKLMVVKTVECI